MMAVGSIDATSVGANTTILGPNTSGYIGMNSEANLGIARSTFMGMSIESALAISISNFVGVAIENSLGVKLLNGAAPEIKSFAIDLQQAGLHTFTPGVGAGAGDAAAVAGILGAVVGAAGADADIAATLKQYADAAKALDDAAQEAADQGLPGLAGRLASLAAVTRGRQAGGKFGSDSVLGTVGMIVGEGAIAAFGIDTPAETLGKEPSVNSDGSAIPPSPPEPAPAAGGASAGAGASGGSDAGGTAATAAPEVAGGAGGAGAPTAGGGGSGGSAAAGGGAGARAVGWRRRRCRWCQRRQRQFVLARNLQAPAMQILKPQALGLSTRPIEFRKRYGLSISAYLHLPFAQGERGCLWAEQSMWSFLAREMAQPLIDEGVVKLTPEFLVHGHAFAPEDRPNACAVRARLGTREKTLLVFGDRYWDGARPSTPRPFASMPLGWAAAYGGADFAANPQGKGREARDGVTWLPNIELPGDRLLRPDQAVAPAGFGALDLMNPQRARHRGTYDADYLQQHAPGFAPDTDWRFFNLAPSDQWMGAALAGDERFAFDNMHPSRPLVEGRLPGMRARVFVGYRVEGSEPKVREVPLRLTTVWFFPHAERCVAIFQGLAEVGTDDGSDVLSLMGAVERNGEPRTDQHYLDAAARRADPRTGALYAIVDSDLLPAGVSTADPDVEAAKAPFAMAGLQGEAQRRRAQIDVELARQKARDMGQDPDALGIRMPPREEVPQGDALPAYLEKVAEDMEAQQWAAVEDAVTALEKAYAMSARQKIDLGALKHRGPPLYKADRHLADLRAQAAVGSRPPDLAPHAAQAPAAGGRAAPGLSGNRAHAAARLRDARRRGRRAAPGNAARHGRGHPLLRGHRLHRRRLLGPRPARRRLRRRVARERGLAQRQSLGRQTSPARCSRTRSSRAPSAIGAKLSARPTSARRALARGVFDDADFSRPC
jgi:hypothetical protein